MCDICNSHDHASVDCPAITQVEPGLRKCMVSKYEKGSDGKWYLVEKGIAVFHQFGVNYENFESGPGNFTTAVVEWPDGKVDNVPVEHIRFLK